MNKLVKEEINKELLSTEFRNKVELLENAMLVSDDPRIIKGNSDTFPLKHSFSEGLYIRQMSMDKNGLVIGKIHKYDHTWFLLQGEIAIAGEDGVEYFTAPYYSFAPAGTKRVIYAMEDCVFVNVHPNPNNITNIEELEERYVCSSYSSFKEFKLLK